MDNFVSMPLRMPEVKTYEELLAYAFRALAMRALSEYELRERLGRRGAEQQLSDRVVQRVQELGYQDDRQLAMAEARRADWGQYRLRQRLLQRGVAPELIEEACASKDEAQELAEARALLERRLSNFEHKKNPKNSALGYLLRRGFAGHVARQVVAELLSA